jgi:hypothetical protein
MQWVPSHPKFFLPVRVLSEVSRGELLERLQKALDEGELDEGDLDAARLLREAARKSWVVYSKRPFAGPRQVLSYLGRYTHRIAISNHRIVSLEDGQVSFEYRDRTEDNRKKLLRLPAKEFLRRFLLHVVPHRLVRIRYYGLLAQSRKAELLDRCREALQSSAAERTDSYRASAEEPALASELQPQLDAANRWEWLCPHCQSGHLIVVGRLSPSETQWFLRGRSTLA